MSTMYFITKRTSETGKKFAEVEAKAKQSHQDIVKLGEELGFDEWREWNNVFRGNIAEIIFKIPPDERVYKKVDSGWMPRLNTKKGKEIQAKIDAVTKVHRSEVNNCIGFQGRWKTIGWVWSDKEYYGFSVDETWKVEIPSDCEEVTASRYKALSEKETE